MPIELSEGDAFLLTYKTIFVGDDVHLFVDNEDNQLKIFFANGYFKVSSGVTIQRDLWYHAVLRYTSSTTDLFVNGNLTLSSNGRFTTYYGYSPLVISSLIDYSASKGRVFGNVDDIRMYKRLLSDADVQALYNYEKNLVAPAPVSDTIVVRDTTIIRDTITNIVTNTIYKLDTVVLGGDCTIYPNPVSANGSVHIETNAIPVDVRIYSSAGQLVKTEKLTTQNFINLTGLPSGTYFIKIVAASGSCGKKLVIIN